MDKSSEEDEVRYCPSSLQLIQQLYGRKVIDLTRIGLTRVVQLTFKLVIAR